VRSSSESGATGTIRGTIGGVSVSMPLALTR
jgi:hypothetical protein